MAKNKLAKCFDGVDEPKYESKGLTLYERTKSRPSDEYYTTRETVETIIDNFSEFLSNRPYIYCPFDTEDSEFVKVLKERGYNVKFTSFDFFDHLEDVKKCKEDGGIILSNPPFSKTLKIFTEISKIGCDFILMDNMLKIKSDVSHGWYCAILRPVFKNGKTVPCILCSNLDIRKVIREKGKEKGNERKTLDGLTYYTQVRDWLLTKDTDVIVPVTFLAHPESRNFEWEFATGKEAKHKFCVVHIIKRIQGGEEHDKDSDAQ